MRLFFFRKRIHQLEMKRNEQMRLGARVLIGYYGTKKIEVINKKYDKHGRILLLEINIDDRLFVLINIC